MFDLGDFGDKSPSLFLKIFEISKFQKCTWVNYLKLPSQTCAVFDLQFIQTFFTPQQIYFQKFYNNWNASEKCHQVSTEQFNLFGVFEYGASDHVFLQLQCWVEATEQSHVQQNFEKAGAKIHEGENLKRFF